MANKPTNSAKQKPTLSKACSEMTMAELEAAAAISDREYADDFFHETPPESKPPSTHAKKKTRGKSG
jgi:hypothetical protein